MENNQSIQDSFNTINSIIEQTRERYEQNGMTILAWGILVSLAGIIQYIMIQNGQGEKSYYSWVFTMIPGFFITLFIKAREGQQAAKEGKSTDRMDFVWLMAGIMAMMTGFIFGRYFGQGFTTMLFVPFCVASFAFGLYLKENTLIICSIIASILAFMAVFVPFIYHPLVASFISLVLMIIPGLKLNSDYKRRHRV